MWAKFDDQFYLNPKNAAMDRDEQDLYIASLIYSNGQLTDGFIPARVLAMLAVWAKLEIEANAQAIASRLVEHGFWEKSEKGWQIHDFLDWNMSKAEAIALKENRSEAGRRGGLASVAKRQASARARAKANAQAKVNPDPDPVPDPIKNIKPLSAQVRKPKIVDERSKHPAILTFKEVVNRYPNKALFDRVISILGDDPDKTKAKTCRVEWLARGYNANSIGWLDWYQTGIPTKNGSKPAAQPTQYTGPNGEVITI